MSAQKTPLLTPTSTFDSGIGGNGVEDLNAVTPIPDDTGMVDVVEVLPPLPDLDGAMDDGMDWDH